jgi:hypothetical protein
MTKRIIVRRGCAKIKERYSDIERHNLFADTMGKK